MHVARILEALLDISYFDGRTITPVLLCHSESVAPDKSCFLCLASCVYQHPLMSAVSVAVPCPRAHLTISLHVCERLFWLVLSCPLAGQDAAGVKGSAVAATEA